MKFRDEAIARKWFASKDTPAFTHLMMDGGKLCIPDDQSGAFLNIYFSSVIIRQEKLSVVEVKTPVFRLFFDLDIRFKKHAHGIQRTILKLSRIIWNHVTTDFFDIGLEGLVYDSKSGSLGSASSLSTIEEEATIPTSQKSRMIVCQAPSKLENGDMLVKHGVHIIFPHIFVNAPIALACRERLLEKLPRLFQDACTEESSIDSSTESTASTSGYAQPANNWEDIVDDSVFKASGLRMIFSGKGKLEGRAYVPKFEMTHHGDVVPCTLDTATTKRAYIRDTSIRVFHNALTPCVGGEHEIADKPGTHAHGGTVIGNSTPIDMYQEALPKLREALPTVYKDTRFLSAFVTSHAVMIKTNSRYCQNKQGEHRTSTIYLCVTKKGVCQRCYCRKDERGCAEYASRIIPLPQDVIRVFFPDTFLDDPDEDKKRVMSMSTKKRKNSLHNVLKRSKILKRIK